MSSSGSGGPPGESPPISPDLLDLIRHADQQLQRLNPAPFSPNALRALKDRVTEYIADLINESAREAKRQQLDTISETHVERAGEYIVSKSGRRFFRHLGTLGGILLGASLSNLLTLATASTVTFASVALTPAFGILGAFAIALHIARD